MRRHAIALLYRILLVCALVLAVLEAPSQAVVAAAPAPANPCATQARTFKLLVERSGIYEVTPVDLQAAGWVGTPNPAYLRVYRGPCVAANEISLDRSPTGVRFYAEESASRYSATATYWLREEPGPALTMPTRTVTPAGAPLQATAPLTATGAIGGEPRYDPVYPGGDGDHFFQADLRAGVTLPITFTLTSPVAGAAGLFLRLQGITAGAHRLRPAFDGVDLDEQTWYDVDPFTLSVPLGTPALAPGPHVLALTIAPGAIDAVLVDGAALRYQSQLVAGQGQLVFDGVAGARRYQVGGFSGSSALIYDIHDPRYPTRLDGATVGATVTWQDQPTQPRRYALLAPGQVLRPTIVADRPSHLEQGGADYLVLGYGAFLPAVEPLAAHYRGKGLRVAVVDVQDVYDEFNGGDLHPEALRGFLRHVAANWSRPAPTYVLLVGDGTYDFRDRGESGWASFVPPYLADVDPWMRETACDTCYGRTQTDDPRDQPLPDLLVGRLPVRSAEQASVVVAKTLGYLTAPPPGVWQSTALLLSDNSFDEQGQAEPAGDFEVLTEGVARALPPGLAARRFLYDPSPAGQAGPPRYPDPAVLRQDFLRAFDDGAALVTYVGHANYVQWGYTAPNATPPYLWYIYDADARRNGGRLPILLSMSCLTGSFHEPTLLGSTDERLLLRAGGGTVASLSPAGQGVAHGHDVFSKAVIGALYGADPTARSLGAAQLAGFQAVLANGCCAEIRFTYELLGDPALQLPFVPIKAKLLPIVRR